MFKTPVTTFKTFLFISLGILIFGDIMVFSAAQVTGLTIGGNSFTISGKQIVLSIVSVAGAWVIAQIPIQNVKKIARIALFLALGFMLLLFPFGVDINGNKNWVSIGPLDFQPSEVAKVLLIIWAAAIIEKNVHNPRQIFFQLSFGFSLVLAIVLLGGDLGSAVVIGLILATLVYLAGADNKLIGILGGLGILGVAGLIAIQPYRIARFTAFIHPFADGIYKNAGWQPAHSLMALGSGGLFGSGIGSSKQKWGNLAEAHTDFIFGVIGEEFGLLGTIATLIAISLLVICIIKIALSAKDTFSRYLGLGIAFWIGFQSLINLASATSLIPVVGVTLPFISYGGSSLLALVGALGFVAGIALRDPQVSKEINVRWPRGAK
ncbi:MAG: FtsW/RodA/SpoVE family cell cycle protein [Actinomycetales bacterium]|nr:FtsW/RodA/SpoVE family cell cycle protein [Actinomycetales bacterium]